MTTKRNQPCPCGSGQRYKSCCAALKKDAQAPSKKEQACTLVDQGNVMLGEKKPEEALKLYRAALAIYPEYARAHYNSGVAYQKIGRTENAIICYRKTLSIDQKDIEANINLGVLLKSINKMEEASACYKKALDFKPDHAEAYNNLGVLYQEQGLLDEAADCSLKALSINPEYAEAYYNLGLVRKAQGNLEEAKINAQKTLAIKSDHTEAHFLLSSLQKYTGNEKHISEMEGLFSLTTLTDEQKMYLAFGLGKAYEDSGVYGKAFNYFKEGNRLKRNTYYYSEESAETEFRQLKSTFTKSFVQNNSTSGNPDNTPIFVLGMPRSGTSLVEQILASHPDVYGAGELYYLRQIISQLTKANSVNQICENISRSSKEIITRLGPDYIHKIRKFSPEAKFITDKMPHNFLWIGPIILALPNASIISCQRDPMDNCLSIYKNHFAKEHNYAYDLQELGHYHLLYQDLMAHWHEVFPGKIYDISYEKLVRDQEEETKKLLSHCGLSWDDSCLSFHKTSRTVATASAAQVRRPIYKDSVQLWKRYEKELKPLSDILLESEISW